MSESTTRNILIAAGAAALCVGGYGIYRMLTKKEPAPKVSPRPKAARAVPNGIVYRIKIADSLFYRSNDTPIDDEHLLMRAEELLSLAEVPPHTGELGVTVTKNNEVGLIVIHIAIGKAILISVSSGFTLETETSVIARLPSEIAVIAARYGDLLDDDDIIAIKTAIDNTMSEKE